MARQAAARRPTEAPPPLVRKDNGAIAMLTLDHPASRNALSEAMMAALQANLDGIAADTRIRAVVLAAKGPSFCAGHDLKEMTARRADADHGLSYYQEVFQRCSRLM